MLSFCIVDDDAVSRRMLQTIIEKGGVGEVVGMAAGGIEGKRLVLDENPDVVLIDLLMPDQDGIETIARLKQEGYEGKYVMISQIENKEMISKAYQAGIEFYIQKPINRVEVKAVLGKVSEQWRMARYLKEIKQSIAKLDNLSSEPAGARKNAKEIMRTILMDMGIIGESGSQDIIEMIDQLIHRHEGGSFPPLKALFEAGARASKPEGGDIEKEGKAVEQRVRRTVIAAISNLASIGLTDYGHPKFEHYAPLYFDFEDVRLKMREIDEKCPQEKRKVNIKKFLQVMYLEVLDKMKAR
ncbi:response regulator [Paenibacillus sacheonensis]|uniref:Response regulator n=1 Tax=Paenibacillus sacheonensis TaxID=742054 RepID=A0A7X4YQ42_9BACL|nr:response regulator [Paenibacillus sacheonensis]MBM7566275.1 two-component system response regulator YcbB [Paenibacillus sacheonensis]NBC70481.1 response regulator [Paenibacillus sacheonensis]